MTFLFWFAALYLAFGLWIGWILLGLGQKHRITFIESCRAKVEALRREPALLLFLLFIAVAWFPIAVIILPTAFFRNRKH